MYTNGEFIKTSIQQFKESGTYKNERIIVSPQSAEIILHDGSKVINFCANNYLGLSNSPELVKAAKFALDTYGYGMSSVRFICGTLDIHKKLEFAVSQFIGTDDAVLYSSCFDANTGLFETLLSTEDAIISDELNHASIIDGIRLCKAKRFVYKNNNMDELEQCLKDARNCRIKLIATDGIFSMDGIVADLKGICTLAEKYGALVMVDDSHATGVIGSTGRGTPEACGVQGRVDIITGTFGKALGGASGGFTATRKEIADLLRQKSRPYLFSNTLCPAIAATTLRALELLSQSSDLRNRLASNTRLFRNSMKSAGFTVNEGEHPIVPVMYGDAKLAAQTAETLLGDGIYVIAFSYPVVPKDTARIRVQLSAAHIEEQIIKAVDSFIRVRDKTSS
ncbi:MAG: glycine C-acetyltransferase [Candidatus Latescibacteria bacterium]|nr:glycine C-acetyltransferase [Candidatus Latescibacterota bacterium]